MHTSILVLIVCALGHRVEAAMLYNGGQSQLFSNLSTSCDAAFNTTLDCPENIVQLLTYPLQSVGWNTTLMTSLCTTGCDSSLQDLTTAVDDGCGDATMTVNDQNMTYTDFVELIQYKFGLVCLQDEDTNDFCSDVEASWNITEMVLLDEAIWPTYTNKCYWDTTQGYWVYAADSNGTCVDSFDFSWDNATDSAGLNQKAALDYYIDRGDPIDDDNYGWFDVLESDEYPLAIQCSSCFLQRFKYGLESSWGDMWDDVTDQVWANMKLNCDLDEDITPAHNFSGVVTYGDDITWTTIPASSCSQNISIDSSTTYTCREAALQFKIPSAGLYNLNSDLSCNALTNTTICAPKSCNVTVVDLGDNIVWTNQTENIANWVASYTNFTLAQFYTWNPYIGLGHVTHGTVVCVGPPGGSYVLPSSTATLADPTVFISTATPAAPTASGTISNCGEYYLVQEGDYCELICEAYGLTFSEFIDLNPSLDSACSNLILGNDYCVAAVNGTFVSSVTSTLAPATTSPTTVTSSTSGSTSTYVTAPSPTFSGTTPDCYEWYTVASGDTCETIDSKYSITLAEFRALNNYVDANCVNLQPGYSYCVSGVAETVTSTTKVSSSTTTAIITTPTPTQTGMARGCKTFYEAQTGDECYDIAAEYGITLNQFYEWNAALNDDCSGLWPDYYYCVGM